MTPKHIPVSLKLINEDKENIAYRKTFAALTDSVTGAILLQQMSFNAKLKNYDPFYKFRQPCSKHELYKDGDSWTEELGFNVAEFDNALKIIATKVTKGVSKKALLETEYPVQAPGESDQAYAKRYEAALRCLVIYWTDANRLTWYQVNTELLDKFINSIYLGKCKGLRYLKKAVYRDTLKGRKAEIPDPEITSEITSEKKIDDQVFEISVSIPTIDDDARGEILLLLHGQRFHGKKRLGKFEYIWEKLLPVAKRPDPMAYMGVWAKVEAHDYWLTFQRTYQQAERLSARNAVNIWQDIEQMTSMDVMPVEIEQVIAWRITPKRKQPYKFEYLLMDIKALRERDKIDDPDLELAICKVFKVQAGDFTRRLARFFEGKEGDLPAWNLYRLKDNPMSARELAAFKRWYDDDERYDNQETPPTTAANLRDKIDLFRASLNHAARVERAQPLLEQWLGVQTQPAPPVVVDEPDAEFAAQIDADVANMVGQFSGGRR